jgi:hypothetical protein
MPAVLDEAVASTLEGLGCLAASGPIGGMLAELLYAHILNFDLFI